MHIPVCLCAVGPDLLHPPWRILHHWDMLGTIAILCCESNSAGQTQGHLDFLLSSQACFILLIILIKLKLSFFYTFFCLYYIMNYMAYLINKDYKTCQENQGCPCKI